MQTEDEHARLNLPGREEAEASGLFLEFYLRGLRGVGILGGESFGQGGGIRSVEGGEPGIQEATGGGVRDLAYLVSGAREVNDDEGMDGGGVASWAGWGGGVGWIAEIDCVDAGGVVVVVVV